MPVFIRIPLTPEQADAIEAFKKSSDGIYLFEGSPHINLTKEHFDRLCRVQARGETMGQTIVNALETGLIQP